MYNLFIQIMKHVVERRWYSLLSVPTQIATHTYHMGGDIQHHCVDVEMKFN